MPEYTLVIKTVVSIEAIDDVEARLAARRKMDYLVTKYMVDDPQTQITLRKKDRVINLKTGST